jgi:hypothetical protein
MKYIHPIYLLILLFVLANTTLAQKSADSSFKTVAAGPEFKKSGFDEWLWGYNRRAEWITPVRVPVLWLDTAYGGLIPYKPGGGNETKTLHLKTTNEKKYSIRSINKSRKEVVPKQYKNTFIENIIDDGISMSHPYGAFAVPVMLQSAGIYHTNPKLVYVPNQPALDTFNKKYGNNLYLFEQRLGDDWSDADNLGNFKKFYETKDVIDTLQDDNSDKADQHVFIKARLFDMFISDWDRHEDNWQWGEKDFSGKGIYLPVPRDRDQAFYTHNGVLINLIISASGLNYMQNFDYDLKDVKAINWEERNMDRFFTNELTLSDWINAAKNLQQSLTDSVIALSVKGLPPEIYSVCGKELIEKLKARRDHLVAWSTDYYLFLAKETEITGSKKRDYFEVKEMNDGDLSVNIFRINKNGMKDSAALYSRIFKPNETKEIRLFGIAGEDIYKVEGNSNEIKVRIIGGEEKDFVVQTGSNKIFIYDDDKNVFTTRKAKLHLSNDSAVHAYDYANHEYNKKGVKPSIFYSNEDRLYIGLGYGFTKYKWRRLPYATKQLIDLHYSLSQKAISTTYKAIYPNVINNWSLSLVANYDAIRWTNFYGLGNETPFTVKNLHFNRMRSEEWHVNAGISKEFGKSSFSASAFFQSVRILNDTERYVSKVFEDHNTNSFEKNNYAGAQLTYTFLNVDDSIVPTQGVAFLVNAAYSYNTTQKDFFQNYSSRFQAYIPLSNKFSLAVRGGVATVVGNSTVINSAQFFEHAVIGGPNSLRGVRRERFWGKTSFFNNNELRFITNLNTHVLNAKAGLLVFFDNGRVWMPKENSNTLHTAYGAGILLAPFGKVSGVITYGISKEARMIQVRINQLF